MTVIKSTPLYLLGGVQRLSNESLKRLLNGSLGQKAAVNIEERTSDVRSFGARKEHHARSDFFGTPVSPERHCRNPGWSPITVLGIHIRIYKTRLQSIYCDVAYSQVSGGDTIEGTYGSFRRGIVGCAVEACTRSCSGTNSNDASVIGQNLRGSASRCEHAIHIDLCFGVRWRRRPDPHPPAP